MRGLPLQLSLHLHVIRGCEHFLCRIGRVPGYLHAFVFLLLLCGLLQRLLIVYLCIGRIASALGRST